MMDPLRPPETDDEPWTVEEELRQQIGRDVAMAAIAGIVIIAILVWIRIR